MHAASAYLPTNTGANAHAGRSKLMLLAQGPWSGPATEGYGPAAGTRGPEEGHSKI